MVIVFFSCFSYAITSLYVVVAKINLDIYVGINYIDVELLKKIIFWSFNQAFVV